MDIHNNTWIGSTLDVVASKDPTLVGRSGIVVDETKNTLVLLEGENGHFLKNSNHIHS